MNYNRHKPRPNQRKVPKITKNDDKFYLKINMKMKANKHERLSKKLFHFFDITIDYPFYICRVRPINETYLAADVRNIHF